MSLWNELLLQKRADIAERRFNALSQLDYHALSDRDKTIMECFGWFCLEYDEEPRTDEDLTKAEGKR